MQKQEINFTWMDFNFLPDIIIIVATTTITLAYVEHIFANKWKWNNIFFTRHHDNRFHRRVVRFTLTVLSFEVHQTRALSWNMAHIKDLQNSLCGCRSFRLKFQSLTSDCRKSRDGKFPKNIIGKILEKIVKNLNF